MSTSSICTPARMSSRVSTVATGWPAPRWLPRVASSLVTVPSSGATTVAWRRFSAARSAASRAWMTPGSSAMMRASPPASIGGLGIDRQAGRQVELGAGALQRVEGVALGLLGLCELIVGHRAAAVQGPVALQRADAVLPRPLRRDDGGAQLGQPVRQAELGSRAATPAPAPSALRSSDCSKLDQRLAGGDRGRPPGPEWRSARPPTSDVTSTLRRERKVQLPTTRVCMVVVTASSISTGTASASGSLRNRRLSAKLATTSRITAMPAKRSSRLVLRFMFRSPSRQNGQPAAHGGVHDRPQHGDAGGLRQRRRAGRRSSTAAPNSQHRQRPHRRTDR